MGVTGFCSALAPARTNWPLREPKPSREPPIFSVPEASPRRIGCLLILPEYGGQTWEDERGYLNGAPEWVGEIGDSTERLDLREKKLDYEKAGVRKYLVAGHQIAKDILVHAPPR